MKKLRGLEEKKMGKVTNFLFRNKLLFTSIGLILIGLQSAINVLGFSFQMPISAGWGWLLIVLGSVLALIDFWKRRR